MISPGDRAAWLDRLAAGAGKIAAAWRDLPAAARAWRPGPGAWSAHELLCHCADAEANGYARIRFLVAEADPVIRAFDENRWAQALDYHALPAETALAVVEALRAHTVALCRRLPDDAWERAGTHTETGRYTAEAWLRGNAEHLEAHAAQIESNQNHWWAAGAPASAASAPRRPPSTPSAAPSSRSTRPAPRGCARRSRRCRPRRSTGAPRPGSGRPTRSCATRRIRRRTRTRASASSWPTTIPSSRGTTRSTG